MAFGAREVRVALRSLARQRGLTVAVIITLGLGMGAGTAIYTLLRRIVLDPLPYPSAERLVRIKNPVPGVGADEEWDLSAAQFFYYAAHVRSLAAIGAYKETGMSLAADEPQRVIAARVTASMMPLLGARAARGRLLDARDDAPGAPRVAVISYVLWRARFAGDDRVVGRVITLDDEPYEVIGVMAPGVELPPERGEGVRAPRDVWLALGLDPAGPFWNNHNFPAIARLAPGATVEQAEREIEHLQGDLPREFPKAYSPGFFEHYGFHTVLQPLGRYVAGDAARDLWTVFGAAGLVLLIACANAANLLLVRLEGRRRELAIRAALGADARALVADALREGLILSLGGAVVALGLGAAGVRWLVALAPPGLPRLDNVRLDGSVVAFALVVAVLVAVALALVPMLQARRSVSLAALGDGGRTGTAGVDRRRLRGALVVAQVALALVLVVSAGLLVRSASRLRAAPTGIDARGVITVEAYLSPERYRTPADVQRFYREVLARVRALPGVVAAGATGDLPFEGGFGCTVQQFEDPTIKARILDAGETTCAGPEATTPGYFEAVGIPVVAGRTFTAGDVGVPASGAVIVSKAFAERFWPGRDPIGQGVASGGRPKPFSHVVGVVGDVYANAVDQPPALAIYYPVGVEDAAPHLVVRVARGDPLSYLPAIRRATWEVDPTVPLANAEAMETVVERSMSRRVVAMTLLGVAGGLALLLAAIGVYALIAYVVARRANEIGIRLALGAQPREVERMVVREAGRLAAAGVVLGIAGAVAFTWLLGGLLFGVTAWDPAAYAVATLVLAGVAIVAAWVPARRAARVDPALALRSE